MQDPFETAVRQLNEACDLAERNEPNLTRVNDLVREARASLSENFSDAQCAVLAGLLSPDGYDLRLESHGDAARFVSSIRRGIAAAEANE